MGKYTIRFNLSRGINFEKWKIRYPDKTIEYFNPNDVTIIMEDCFLRNQKGTATKIFNGSDKTVCAWIESESILIKEVGDNKYEITDQIKYNPRINPFWTMNDTNIDGVKIDKIISIDRELFKLKNPD